MKAAAEGLGLADLSALFAEMYERARADLPDEDPDRGSPTGACGWRPRSGARGSSTGT